MTSTLKEVSGRAWVFGNNVDTDQIIQGRYLTLLNYKKMAQHAFEIPRPEFARKVNRNDIIVAGTNFGGGSSREEAPRVLVELGVGCVVAESFARIFYRNGFNVGLPLVIAPEASSKVEDGMSLVVDFVEGTISMKDSGQIIQGERIPSFMREILEAGGAVEWYLQHNM